MNDVHDPVLPPASAGVAERSTRARSRRPLRCLRRAACPRGADGGDRGGLRRIRRILGRSDFLAELDRLQRDYTGRPSPVFECTRLSEHAGGARILLKREDLNHTGSHKINNVLGQALLAKRMGKTRVIAETGAGQHGVATATAARCWVWIAWSIWARSTPRARRSTSPACGCSARSVVPVTAGSQTLKDAINEALRDWVTNAEDTYYCFGTAAGRIRSRPWCAISSASSGTKRGSRCSRRPAACRTLWSACVGGGSNAIGIFHAVHRRCRGAAGRIRGGG